MGSHDTVWLTGFAAIAIAMSVVGGFVVLTRRTVRERMTIVLWVGTAGFLCLSVWTLIFASLASGIAFFVLTCTWAIIMRGIRALGTRLSASQKGPSSP
jgi:hypothetical protein